MRTARQPMDFYETPPHYLAALDATLRLPPGLTIVEPCVGDGAIAKHLAQQGHRVITNDLDRQRKAHYHDDARHPYLWERLNRTQAVDWSITNPPFESIDEITMCTLLHAKNVVTLARLSFLEPTRFRRGLYTVFGEPKLIVVLPRYKFTEPSKDTMTCCWLGWGPEIIPTFRIWYDE